MEFPAAAIVSNLPASTSPRPHSWAAIKKPPPGGKLAMKSCLDALDLALRRSSALDCPDFAVGNPPSWISTGLNHPNWISPGFNMFQSSRISSWDFNLVPTVWHLPHSAARIPGPSQRDTLGDTRLVSQHHGLGPRPK